MRISKFFFVSILAVWLTAFSIEAFARGLLEDIDPFAKTEDVIQKMEESLNRLIQEFGETLEQETLKALQNATAALQSAKLASSDILDQAFRELDEDRAAVVADAATLIEQTSEMLGGKVNKIAETEQRFSDTLERVARASKEPWVLSYGPPLFMPSRSGEVRIEVHGKYLDHPENRLIASEEEIAPSASLPNKVNFSVPRKFLKVNATGFSSFKLRLNHNVETGMWWWKKTDVIAREVVLELRSAGQKLGSYRLESTILRSPSYDVMTERMTYDNPVNLEQCLEPPEGGAFDPAYTQMRIAKNARYRSAHTVTIAVPHLFKPHRITQNIPAETLVGAADAARISLNAPERICVTFNSPTNPAQHINKTTVGVDVVHRVRGPATETSYSTAGEIFWDKDIAEVLPADFQGFRAFVNFDAGKREGERVFTRPDNYGPLKVLFDPTSRTVVFRPIPVE